ncbi:hypothetical protein [Actinoplanes flavus]|uniref:Uncharacterized protein n=1 Tax=Actinoplanes flavus TaxID=2820290 RepID=A0ABS3UD21_9ACTN|nr:hypothetical protein [Actinoplanes flavus]MBO3736670.1 hypothetical protein [Actinoplanes flavus]
MPFSSFRFFPSRRNRRRQIWPVVHADDTKLTAHRQQASLSESDELLQAAVDALDPVSASFGCDVADFIDACVSRQILTFDAPITGIRIEPTVLGERRDGGFLVLVTVGHVTTVASGQLSARLFRGADDVAAFVLAAVLSTADKIYRALLSTAADLPRSRS